MKSVRTLIMACLFSTAAGLFAQTVNHQLMKVKVPFSFSVQNQSLPAGEYIIFTVLPERAILISSASAAALPSTVFRDSVHTTQLCQFACGEEPTDLPPLRGRVLPHSSLDPRPKCGSQSDVKQARHEHGEQRFLPPDLDCAGRSQPPLGSRTTM